VKDLDFDPDDIPSEPSSVTTVAELAQTDAGRWYPKKIRKDRHRGWESHVSTESTTVYLQTNSNFPEGIFDPESLLKGWVETAVTGTQVPDEAVEANGPNVPAAQVGTCKGYVTDEDGRAIPNVWVALYYNHNRRGLGDRIVEETVSDANGRFTLESPIEFIRITDNHSAQDSYAILATHPDYALGWCNIRRGGEQPRYEVILTSPLSHTMTVTDHNGNPLSGVRVWPRYIGDREGSNPFLRDVLRLRIDVGLIGGVTDANGRAVITNLPRTECSFGATLKGYAAGLTMGEGDHIRLNRGADVHGWVLTENQEPVEGALVKFHPVWMGAYSLAKTDAEGYFYFEDLPAQGWDLSPWRQSEKADGRYIVSIRHERYAAQEKQLKLLPDQVIDDFIIEAYSGTLITCHVIDAETNEPVAGARIAGDNKVTGRIDGFSDANGVYTVRVARGETWLAFCSPPEGVYVIMEQNLPGSFINFDANGPEMTFTLKGPHIGGCLTDVVGTVLNPDGLTSGDAIVYASAAERYATADGSGYRSVGVDDDGWFELKGVPAGCRLCIYAETKDRRLAGTGVLAVPKEPNEPPHIELQLKPTQKASKVIEYEPGDPAAKVSLDVKPVVEGQIIFFVSHDEDTDERGLLEMNGIIPGLEYYVRDERINEFGRGPYPGEKWFEGIVVLIPPESDPNVEPAEGRD
jgi:protocatechuate 3,4-dioxygenase beta subunit